MMAFALDDPATRAADRRQHPAGPHRPPRRHGRRGDLPGLRAGAYLTGTVIPVDGGITC